MQQPEKRNRWIPPVRVTEQEWKRLDERFKKTNCKFLADFIRRVLLNDKITAFYRNQSLDDLMAELIELRKELNAIGRNINMIARRLQLNVSRSEQRKWAEESQRTHQLLLTKMEEINKKSDQIAQIWLQS
jgi:hypothetical protein